MSHPDEVERIQQERPQAEQRLKPLGIAYVDGLYSDDDYRREKRALLVIHSEVEDVAQALKVCREH